MARTKAQYSVDHDRGLVHGFVVLQQLEDDGLADDRIVFFIGDHGRCHIRGKQFLYEAGVRIPLIVRWPKHIKAGSVSSELVSSLDICQSIVKLAGAKPANELHGLYLFDEQQHE